MVSLKLGAALAAMVILSAPARADVHLVRSSNGSAVIFNDIGSGWRVNGKAPTDAYLLDRQNAPTPYDETIRAVAGRHGVDPRLVKSVMLIESNYNAKAVSRKGARGLMQLMPGTARRYGVSNSFDAVENIGGGVRYLADLLIQFGGNVTLALAAYNAGEGSVAKHSGVPPYPETVEYIRRAMVVYQGTGIAPAVLDGGFQRLPAAAPAFRIASMLTRSAPVRLHRDGGTRLLSNVEARRPAAPVLGRVDDPARPVSR